jgi:uncharacterized protein DUF87
MKFIIGTSDSKNIKVDAAILADTRALINASSGLGKSWLLRLIAENVASSIQTILIDPEGEFPTLREKLDLLIVSENGDLRADIRSAGLLARKLAETGVSAVIDIYDLPGKEDPWTKRRMFVAEFIREIMNLPKKLYHPMLIIVDEAHEFAQQEPSTDWLMWQNKRVYPALLSRSAIRTMMSAGRKRGIGGILATQRISKIDKDSIADARNMFMGGATLDLDQKRAGDILGMNKAEAVATLRDLEPGMFFAFGPAIEGKGVVQFTSAPVKTTHPKAGQRSSIVVPRASTQIAGIVDQFGDLPAAAEEEVKNLDALKKENEELHRQLRARPVQVQPETKIERVEVPVFPNGQFQAMMQSLLDIKSMTADIRKRADIIESYPLSLEDMIKLLKQNIEKYSSLSLPQSYIRSKMGAKPVMGMAQARGKDHTAKAPAETTNQQAAPTDDITGPQQRILDAMAWMESIGLNRPKRSIVAFLAGYSASSTGFTIPLGNLRKYGWAIYPDSETVELTQEGRARANHPPALLTTEELHASIFSKLTGPQARILKPLIDAYPDPMNREELADRAGYSASSTGFTIPLGNLRSMGLIDYPDSTTAIALSILFLDQ